MSENETAPEVETEPTGTEIPEGLSAGQVCVHELRPEIMRMDGVMDAMKITVVGHMIGAEHADEDLFALVSAVPNAAVFASRILDEVTKADQVTQMITTIALAGEQAKSGFAPNPEEAAGAADFMSALAEAFGGGVPINTETAPGPEESDEPHGQGDGFDPYGEDLKPRGFAPNATADDPVRIMYLGNPAGRSTFAPVDNRSDFPDDMGGYL